MKFECAKFTGAEELELEESSGEKKVTISATFRSATFGSFAEFKSATFSNYADFRSAKFCRRANFESATFNGYTDFSSATFTGGAHFEKGHFKVLLALFDATFGRDVSVAHAQFNAKPVPVPDVSGDEVANALRNIKKIMSDRHHFTEQGRFHALEQRAMLCTNPFDSRNPVKGCRFGKLIKICRVFFDKLISTGYWLISDYGVSPARSVIAFAVIFALWACLIYPALSVCTSEPYDTARFAFQQILTPFQVLLHTPETIKGCDWNNTALIAHPAALRIWACLQSTLHITIFALFLLAIRRRFKMT